MIRLISFIKGYKVKIAIASVFILLLSGQYAYIWKLNKDVEKYILQTELANRKVLENQSKIDVLNSSIETLNKKHQVYISLQNRANSIIQKLQIEIESYRELSLSQQQMLQEIKDNESKFFEVPVPDSVVNFLNGM
jgi:alpha-L-arabinofuranosidase